MTTNIQVSQWDSACWIAEAVSEDGARLRHDAGTAVAAVRGLLRLKSEQVTTQELWEAVLGGRVRVLHPPEWVCGTCGSAEVECAMWVNPNTEEVSGDFGTFNENDSTHCACCDEHRTLVRYAPREPGESLDECGSCNLHHRRAS